MQTKIDMIKKMATNQYRGKPTPWGYAVPCFGFIFQNVTPIQVILETIRVIMIAHIYQGSESKLFSQGHIQVSWFLV